MPDITRRMTTLDSIADRNGGRGDLAARAATMDDWQTVDGGPMGTLDDVQTIAPPAPMARFTVAPPNPVVDEQVTLDGSGSEGAITRYTWLVVETGERPADAVVVEVAFASAGRYTVGLGVSGPGGSNQVMSSVDVIDAPEGEAERAARPQAKAKRKR